MVTERAPGTSAARNAALAVARHDVVLFLGDDTVPETSDLLASHLKRHTERPANEYGILGHVAWAPQIEVPLMRWLERGRQFSFDTIRDGLARAEHFYTAHVSVKRSFIHDVGTFDQRLLSLFLL